MLDFDFSKMALIAVVALIVLGPERLPRVARMAGALFGRARQYADKLKSQVTHEMELDELRRLKTQFESTMSRFEDALDSTMSVRGDALPVQRGLESPLAVAGGDAPVAASQDDGASAVAFVKRASVDTERRRNWRSIRAGQQHGKRMAETSRPVTASRKVRSGGVRSAASRQSVHFL
ncbi:Sec-independent protein translocase protein TatB [Paraburkholderia sp. RL17-337-BIB-A]|uniref:Sec-independent protein translocase protein TatB n=1 Tax=Paraburkholderia sp. RL17-337-BIB-A TaxID=3031636 RepID=UPI0038BA76A6